MTDINKDYKCTVDSDGTMSGADINGDGHITEKELRMHLEYKRKELEDDDALRDAQRRMAWFSLIGMLFYPFAVIMASFLEMEPTAKILGDMAATYFVSVSAIVIGYYGKDAFTRKNK